MSDFRVGSTGGTTYPTGSSFGTEGSEYETTPLLGGSRDQTSDKLAKVGKYIFGTGAIGTAIVLTSPVSVPAIPAVLFFGGLIKALDEKDRSGYQSTCGEACALVVSAFVLAVAVAAFTASLTSHSLANFITRPGVAEKVAIYGGSISGIGLGVWGASFCCKPKSDDKINV